MPAAQCDDDDVLGKILRRANPKPEGPSVLGNRAVAAEPAAVLPFTGGSIIPLTLLALLVIVAGALFAGPFTRLRKRPNLY